MDNNRASAECLELSHVLRLLVNFNGSANFFSQVWSPTENSGMMRGRPHTTSQKCENESMKI